LIHPQISLQFRRTTARQGLTRIPALNRILLIL